MPPSEPTVTDDVRWVLGAEGVRLFESTRLPEGAVRGVIYFVLGAEIASDLYPRFMAAARAADFLTAVLLPRGTGYSHVLRGDLPDYRLFLGDQKLGLERAQQHFAGKPIFLFGHTAGTALALELAAMSPVPHAGLILVNPAYKLSFSEVMGPSWADYFVYTYNYLFRPSALTVDMISKPSAIKNADDRAEGEAMQRDPLVVRFFSMRYLLAQKKVMDRCAVNTAATSIPLLLVQGTHDALVDPVGSDEILAAARTTDKTKLIAPNGGHGSSSVETMVDELLQH